MAAESRIEIHDATRVGGEGTPDRHALGQRAGLDGAQVRHEVDDVVPEAQAGIRGERDVVVGQDGDDVLHAGAPDRAVRKLGVQACADTSGWVGWRGMTHVRGVGEAAAASVQQDRRLEGRHLAVVQGHQPDAPVREAGHHLGHVPRFGPCLRERRDAPAQPRDADRDELGGRQHVGRRERDEGHGVRMPSRRLGVGQARPWLAMPSQRAAGGTPSRIRTGDLHLERVAS